jgi:hypothetical protein
MPNDHMNRDGIRSVNFNANISKVDIHFMDGRTVHVWVGQADEAMIAVTSKMHSIKGREQQIFNVEDNTFRYTKQEAP